MTILFVDQQSSRAGAQRVLDAVLQTMVPQCRPIVAFPGDGPYPIELQGRGIETVFYPLGQYRSGTKSITDMLRFAPRSMAAAARLTGIIRRSAADLVYINGPRCLPAGLAAARLAGTAALFHLHLTITRRMDRVIASQFARRCDAVIACSRTTAQALATDDPQLKRLIRVVYNPLQPAAPVPKLAGFTVPASGQTSGFESAPGRTSPGPFTVGLVGRVTAQKGHHVLLDAVRRLPPDAAFKLLFVGAPAADCAADVAYQDKLKQMIGPKFERRVTWTGYLDDPNPCYRQMDVLVIPSLVSEGLPMVALEAMRWGVPVIGSRVGGIPEVVRHGVNGYLVAPGDAASISERLQALIEDPALRERLSAEALASIDGRFSFEVFRQSLYEVLGQIVPGLSFAPHPRLAVAASAAAPE
jgi:glycosyltransferase involved in cell wall biosynthesis